MGTRIAATYYPHKALRKEAFYRRITRITGFGLAANIIVLVLNLQVLYKDKLNFHWPKKEIPPPVKVLKDTVTCNFTHKPFLYAGHSFPKDSTGTFPDRATHYARTLYLLDPGLEEQYHVTTIMHEVLKGQTLYTIAKKYNVTVQSLKIANDLTSNELKPGKILRIQKAEEPLGYYGIDVSSWQNNIDWTRVHQDTLPAPLKFFIVKATQGTDITDFYFKNNWEHAKTGTTLMGAYHFFVSDEDPVLQANNYIRAVQLKKGDLLPIIDLEYDCAGCNSLLVDKNTFVKNLMIFISLIEKHYGVKPILYTYAYFYEENLKGHFDDYTYWVARYASAPPSGMSVNGASASNPPFISMWQFSCSERIRGVTGNVDITYLPAAYIKKVLF
ncbi:MAG: GH25 family lysozyme [Bacteroidia bacterium]